VVSLVITKWDDGLSTHIAGPSEARVRGAREQNAYDLAAFSGRGEERFGATDMDLGTSLSYRKDIEMSTSDGDEKARTEAL